MTDTEIIETLAKRMGKLTPYSEHYIVSLDALRPVLATLSEEEWRKLDEYFWCKDISKPSSRYFSTLPPRTLAEAIATVIKEKDKP